MRARRKAPTRTPDWFEDRDGRESKENIPYS